MHDVKTIFFSNIDAHKMEGPIADLLNQGYQVIASGGGDKFPDVPGGGGPRTIGTFTAFLVFAKNSEE